MQESFLFIPLLKLGSLCLLLKFCLSVNSILNKSAIFKPSSSSCKYYMIICIKCVMFILLMTIFNLCFVIIFFTHTEWCTRWPIHNICKDIIIFIKWYKYTYLNNHKDTEIYSYWSTSSMWLSFCHTASKIWTFMFMITQWHIGLYSLSTQLDEYGPEFHWQGWLFGKIFLHEFTNKS
jgi:hypothetical protein